MVLISIEYKPAYALNPLHTSPRSFPIDGEVANLLRTCYGETGVMDFGLYRMSSTNGLW